MNIKLTTIALMTTCAFPAFAERPAGWEGALLHAKCDPDDGTCKGAGCTDATNPGKGKK